MMHGWQKNRMRGFRVWLILLAGFIIAACQPTEQDLPTLVPVPSDTATLPPSETPFPTATPTITPTRTPEPITGRSVSDPTRIGYVRVVHAAPDSGPVDVYFSGTSVVSNLTFTQATGRTNVLAGDYTVAVTERGTLPDTGTLAVIPLTLRVGQSYIIVYGGVPGATTLATFEESLEPVKSGESRVNFIHAVPLAPLTKAQINEIDLSPLFDFGQQSGSIAVTSGPSTLNFASSEQVLASTPLDLAPRTGYTVVMTGRSDQLDRLTTLVFSVPVPVLASMRVIQMAPDIGAVDVYLDETLLVGNIGYRAASERTQQTDGTHRLSIYPAGADRATTEPLLTDATFEAAADAVLSLVVMGPPDALRVLPFSEDLAPVTLTESRMSFINTRPDVPTAQIGTDSSVRDDLAPVPYGHASPYIPMSLGTFRIFWFDDNLGFIEDAQQGVTIDSGRSYLYFLTGDSDNPAIFSEVVPVEAELVELPDATLNAPVVTPDIPRLRVRVVNAMDDATTIDVLVNGSPLGTNLAFGSGTVFMDVPPGSFPVQISESGSGLLLGLREIRLIDTIDFTLMILGPAIDPQVRAVNDSGLALGGPESTGATLRILNMSRDEALAVGLVDSEPTDPLAGDDNIGSSLPIGTVYTVPSVAPQDISTQILLPPQVRDLIVMDNRTATIAFRFRSLNFEVSGHYDLVVVYPVGAPAVRAFILRYPTP